MNWFRRLMNYKLFARLFDEWCAHLCSLGIDAHLEEEKEFTSIVINGSPIDRIHLYIPLSGDEMGTVQYIIPDIRGIPSIDIRSVILKKKPIFGAPVDVQWGGNDSNSGIKQLLAEDERIRGSIMINGIDIEIKTHPKRESWLINQKSWLSGPRFVTYGQWRCFELIAQRLLLAPIL